MTTASAILILAAVIVIVSMVFGVMLDDRLTHIINALESRDDENAGPHG